MCRFLLKTAKREGFSSTWSNWVCDGKAASICEKDLRIDTSYEALGIDTSHEVSDKWLENVLTSWNQQVFLMSSYSPHEWIFIEGKCYFFEKTKASFNEAASLCSAKGGKLFEPQNKKINGQVISNHHIHQNIREDMFANVWIGIQAPENMHKYGWKTITVIQ